MSVSWWLYSKCEYIGKAATVFVFRGLVYICHVSSAGTDDKLYVTLRPTGHHTPNKVTAVHPAAHAVLSLSVVCCRTLATHRAR